jgi:regulator of sirC expression with transglutaminase-like and TPR domain
MTEPGLWDRLEAVKAGAFERLVAGRCPPPGELLLAIAAEFREVSAGAVSFRLDELARGLFEAVASRDVEAIAHGLAAVVIDEQRFRRDESSADGLLIDLVLARRAGHPLALSVVAAEVGRRAGVAVGVCSTPTGWYAAIGEADRVWLIDPATDARPTPTGPVRPHCGHEIAFAALTGLYARFIRDRDDARAGRAEWLRRRLPVERG